MKNRIVFLLINNVENDNISIYDLLKKQLKILHFYESSTFREQNKNENKKVLKEKNDGVTSGGKEFVH